MDNSIPSSSPLKAFKKALHDAEKKVDKNQTRTGENGEIIYSDKTGKKLFSISPAETTCVYAEDGKLYVQDEGRIVISDPSKDLAFYYLDKNKNDSYEKLCIYRKGDNPEVWENDKIMDKLISRLEGTYTKSKDSDDLQYYDTKRSSSGREYYNESTGRYEPSMWKDIKTWFNSLF